MQNFKILHAAGTDRLRFLLALLLTISIILACGGKKEEKVEIKEEVVTEETTKETTKGGVELYFCEDYVNGREVGVSDRFTPGWLTVMVDLRPAGETLGTGKVELRITQIADAAGNTIGEKIIDTVPFDVQADWNYTYFQDKSRLKFSRPGTYKITLQKVDGTPIVSGQVEVIPG